VSGFIAANEAEALSAITRLAELDRGGVRRAFEQRFTARRMAENYVNVYRNLVIGAERPQLSAAE